MKESGYKPKINLHRTNKEQEKIQKMYFGLSNLPQVWKK